MEFHYAVTFFLLIPFAVLMLLFAWARWQRRREFARLGDARLIREMIPVESLSRRNKKDSLVLLGLLFLMFSATGPQFGAKLKEVRHRGVDVFIAIDTSRSMLAEDVPPNRMARAKQSLSYLIKKLDGNRLGVIAFAKFAVLQCPLTVDNDAARMFLDVIDERTVPEQGTAMGDAIRLATRNFQKDDKSGKAIVLLTDGEDHKSDPIEAAKEAKKAGITVFTIGIGTTKGDVIKEKDDQGKVTEFHKYKGEMVVSRLDDALLSKVATLTGGQYYRASSTDKEIDEIADILNGFDKKEYASKIYQRLEERYQVFAFIAFLLLLLEFLFAEKSRQWSRIKTGFREHPWLHFLNRKLFACLLATLFIPGYSSADMKDHVIKGNKLFKNKDFSGARAEFESALIDAPENPLLPYNIGATHYLEGNFEDAKKSYEQSYAMTKDPKLKTLIAYNQGHLLFSMGDRSGAIEKFKESLRLNPNDMDAKYNIEYIKSGKNPPPQPQSQQKKNEKGSESKDKQDQKEGEGEGPSDKQETKQERPGELSKEDAERVLQMMQEQEKEKFRDSKPIQMGTPSKDNKKEYSGEDW